MLLIASTPSQAAMAWLLQLDDAFKAPAAATIGASESRLARLKLPSVQEPAAWTVEARSSPACVQRGPSLMTTE